MPAKACNRHDFSYADCCAVLPRQEQTGAQSPYRGMEKVQSAASRPIEKSRALIARDNVGPVLIYA